MKEIEWLEHQEKTLRGHAVELTTLIVEFESIITRLNNDCDNGFITDPRVKNKLLPELEEFLYGLKKLEKKIWELVDDLVKEITNAKNKSYLIKSKIKKMGGK